VHSSPVGLCGAANSAGVWRLLGSMPGPTFNRGVSSKPTQRLMTGRLGESETLSWRLCFATCNCGSDVVDCRSPEPGRNNSSHSGLRGGKVF